MMYKRFTSLLLIGSLFISVPSATLAKPEKKMVEYVALGDSLAAGWTPYNQDGAGYGEYLKARFEQSQYTVGFNNFGVPGYTSGQLKAQLNDPNVIKTLKEAELITIDIGANDLLRALKTGDQAKIQNALITVNLNLEQILKAIDSINPKVNVYVMGYYNPFPYLPKEHQASIMPLLNALNQLIEARTVANGDTFVPTEEIIAIHFEEYLPNPQDIHLSLEGYQIVGKEFWKAIVKNQG